MKYSLVLLLFCVYFVSPVHADYKRLWQVQSIDTMKYSRDVSRQVLNNPENFTSLIESQVREIAEIGATHVGVGTPYDEEFVPVLKLWVAAARKYNLNVWFRGNFAGWEGWFEYPKIDRNLHKTLLQRFLYTNSSLLQSGDIFTPCPECENGGPGDPRKTGDVEGFREFMIEESRIAHSYLKEKGLVVVTTYASMNADVAKLVMDPATTQAMGGIVTIDHYVGEPAKLAGDVRDIATRSQGSIVLGEYGAPIPDLHGDMNEQMQAEWIQNSLTQLAVIPNLVGLNYWVSRGGSTALFDASGEREAAKIVRSFFVNSWSPFPLFKSVYAPEKTCNFSYPLLTCVTSSLSF